MIIECKSCGNAFKGELDKPFLCPKCIEKGITLESLVEENPKKIEKDNIEKNNVEKEEKTFPIFSEKKEEKVEKVDDSYNFEVIDFTKKEPKEAKEDKSIISNEVLLAKMNQLEMEIAEISNFLHRVFK